MSEFITILVGQCGNQIGSVFLPEILKEYGIAPKEATRSKKASEGNISSFFHVKDERSIEKFSDLKRTKVKARLMCVDMEESVVFRNKTGLYKDLYENHCFVTNDPGSGNNFAQGFCAHGPKYESRILDDLKYHVEKTKCLHGFLVVLSMGGGTGSGLGSFVLNLLHDHYPKIDRFVVCVYPTGMEDVITCPYNMALATAEIMKSATCVFPVENRAIFDIIHKNAKNSSQLSSVHKSYEDVNSIVVDMMLHVTSGARFPGKLNLDMRDISTNMVPFPALNFLSTGSSPHAIKTDRNQLNKKQQKTEIFLNACSRNNQLIKIDPIGCKSVSLGVTLLGRGDYVIGDMCMYTERLSKKLKYTAWSEKAMHFALCRTAPRNIECAMFAMFNTSAMSGLFAEIRGQYVKLYQRKAHLHHYTQVPGFDQAQFDECLESLDAILQQYEQLTTP